MSGHQCPDCNFNYRCRERTFLRKHKCCNLRGAGRGAAEPDGVSVAHPPPPPSNGAPKPQFYFGEDVLNGHESNGDLSLVSRKQSAIDKVKTNEAVSHPKNIVINPGYKIKDYVDPTEKSGKPSFAFGEVPVTRKTSAASNAVEMARLAQF